MAKINIGITGQSGFIGSWLYRKAAGNMAFNGIPFEKEYFNDTKALRTFTEQCDVIVHLAGLSRHNDGELLYKTNVELTEKLIAACDTSQKILLGSTTHEKKDAPYHASKRKSAELLDSYGNSTVLLMANTFGPGSKPFYNSAVSTFCKLAADGTAPERIDDVSLLLIFIDDLCRNILNAIKDGSTEKRITIPHTAEYSLKQLWSKLQEWKDADSETVPHFDSLFESQLYFTFRSYCNF